jgi:hypothetical protein
LKEVSLIDKNYFLYEKGILAYFPENQSYFYATEALCADRGFERLDLPNNFVVPSDHKCIVTPDSRIFLLGGRMNNKSLADCFEVQINNINFGSAIVTKIAQMNEPRSKFAAVHLNNCIYVLGGKRDGALLASCERYNITLSKW